MCVEDRIQVVKWQEAAERFRIERDEARRDRDRLQSQIDEFLSTRREAGPSPLIYSGRPQRSRSTGPCPCACNSGGFCGGCGHAGCGGRR